MFDIKKLPRIYSHEKIFFLLNNVCVINFIFIFLLKFVIKVDVISTSADLNNLYKYFEFFF